MTQGDKFNIGASILTGASLLVALSLWFGRLNEQVTQTQVNVSAMEQRRSADHDVLVNMEQDLRAIKTIVDQYAKSNPSGK